MGIINVDEASGELFVNGCKIPEKEMYHRSKLSNYTKTGETLQYEELSHTDLLNKIG